MMQTVSVIIEWENAKLSELERANEMLVRLGKQMIALAQKRDIKAELIVLYDNDEIDASVPKTAVGEAIPSAEWPGVIKFVEAPHQRYYEQKNTGADLATGDLLIFLDSDVVPDEGWLEGLITAMDDPKITICGGETYHATDTYNDRIFAAFWTFTPKKPNNGIYTYKNFYANNFAVRRAYFLTHKFPDASAYRGQCSMLARRLREEKMPIYRQGASTVSHPPPVGARTFIVRAVCQGYDTVYWKNQRPLGMLLNTNPVASLVRLIRQWFNVFVKVAKRAGKVGLGPLGALNAIGAGIAFYWWKFVGEVVAFFTPNVIRSNLSV
ncbi:glycosyltransferase [Terricaulis sp.]|uniref:glycosyltransferase n=1 Tax=Terricaulis sp. TaxID=2768686 RepID=UPI003783332F